MIIQHYDGYINYERLFQMTNTSKSGTTAYDLVKTLIDLGFESYGIDTSINKLKDVNYPLIAHVILDNSYHHFIVIYNIDYQNELLTIADPASKIKKISFNEFNKITSNNFIICYPTKVLEKEKQISVTNYIKKIIISKDYINLIIYSFLSLFISLAFLIMIKNMLNKNNSHYLSIIFIIILKYIINKIKNKKMLNKKINIEKKLTQESFKDILTLPYMYYRNHTTGELISRMEDLDTIKSLIDLIIIISNDFILTIISGILLFLINKTLFLVTLIIVSLYIVNYLFYKDKIKEAIEELKNAKAMLNSYLTETIVGFESIKNQNLETIFESRFNEKYINYSNKSHKYQIFQNNIQNICTLISDLSVFTIITIGIHLSNKNNLDFVNLIAFYTLFGYFIEPIKNLTQYNMVFSEVKSSLKRILNLKYHVVNKRKIKCYDSINIDDEVKINKGENVFLTGQSGSGKSTLLKTLKQYYQFYNIKIGNKKIDKINMNENITYVSQNEYLFTDTLYNNITMYRKIDNKKLHEIIKLCHLDSLIKKHTNGINMIIEENGFNLSGGEKQRVILARSLVNLKDYLFIDEGLSEVDISLERQILKQIIKKYNTKTFIFVSHRLDNLDLFDKMINTNNWTKCLKT